ncbi:elicitor-associated permease-like protein [Bacillus kwashiorkori]|uniref:elicitor-associated permease-like protein n=1 Tax=Bacillus kwashiorkori TaxID=1522318 RepID=UPI000781FEE4|nr:elicitor-associated permease-like protein [Bacillus kwashiorkori]
MQFIQYVSLKYKIKKNHSNMSKMQVYAGWFAGILLYSLFIAIMYFIIKLFPSSVQVNMNKYTASLYAFLCIVSISTAVKNFYHEYFLSPEREILLFVPIRHSQVILSRFFVITEGIVFFNFIVLFSFVLANVLAGNIHIFFLVITSLQIIALSIFSSSFAHVLYSFAFFLSKGRALRSIAFTIMTGASISVIFVIIYIQNYSSFFLTNNSYISSIFYVLFSYPLALISSKLGFSDVIIFSIGITFSALLFFVVSYFLTKLAYRKGFITVTIMQAERTMHSAKISQRISDSRNNFFIKKDLLYLVRNPKLFSAFVSPILFISLIEYKNQFASWGVFLTILLNIIAITFTIVLLNIIFSDDLNNQELLFVIPFNIRILYKNRSKLLHILAFLFSSIFIVIICFLESVQFEFIVFAVLQLLVITYIHSKVLVARVIKRNIGNRPAYWYSGKMVKDIFIHFLKWNIPLMILFSFLQEYFRRFLVGHPFSLQAYIVLSLSILMILIMLNRSIRIDVKGNRNQ